MYMCAHMQIDTIINSLSLSLSLPIHTHLLDHVGSQHHHIQPIMEALRGSKVTNPLGTRQVNMNTQTAHTRHTHTSLVSIMAMLLRTCTQGKKPLFWHYMYMYVHVGGRGKQHLLLVYNIPV